MIQEVTFKSTTRKKKKVLGDYRDNQIADEYLALYRILHNSNNKINSKVEQ